jgi:hypothetical protein
MLCAHGFQNDCCVQQVPTEKHNQATETNQTSQALKERTSATYLDTSSIMTLFVPGNKLRPATVREQSARNRLVRSALKPFKNVCLGTNCAHNIRKGTEPPEPQQRHCQTDRDRSTHPSGPDTEATTTTTNQSTSQQHHGCPNGSHCLISKKISPSH